MNFAFKKFFVYLLFSSALFLTFYYWWQDSSFSLSSNTSTILISLGRICGLLLAFLVLFQFLVMGRTRWVERLFGLDRLSRLHHWTGFLLLIFLVSHPLLLILGYSEISKTPIPNQFINMILNFEDVLKAFFAALIFLSIGGFSIWIVRKHLRYEYWYFIHLATYVAIILAWGHQLKLGSDFNNQYFANYWTFLYFFVFGNLILFRFLRPLFLFVRHRFKVSKIISEGTSSNSVYIEGKSLDHIKIRPGQFVKVRFLNKKQWWEEHPFSFSMVPNDKKFRLTIKNSGDFTSKIGELKLGSRVWFDGPYGVFTLDQTKKEKLLFIAGGIGITPIRSLIEEAAKERRDIILMYSNKTEDDIVLKKELDDLSLRYGFRIYYFLTEYEKTKFEKGHIDYEKIKKLVNDVEEREVFLCGPINMMKALKSDLMNLGVQKNLIHYEKFALS